MKILVFSDSHGNTAHMERAVELMRPDQVLHLGDVARDAQALARRFPQLPVTWVAGNCDGPGTGDPEQQLLTLEGRCILMTHGHRYQVKLSPYTAILAAKEAGAQILLFGHTHNAVCFREGGLWVMNPGSIRGPYSPSYGMILLDGEKTECALVPV